MPKFKQQNTAYYKDKKAIKYNFCGENISSDGGLLLLSKLERKQKWISSFASLLPDYRSPFFTIHSYEKQIQQRVFCMALGYEDCNDAAYLQADPIANELLEMGLCSQSTLCRLENSITKQTIFTLCNWWIDKYVNGLNNSKEAIIIDIDTTDDPTHGQQQLSLFHGYYWQWMYQQLFFIDGNSGELILPVLMKGTSAPSKWMPYILAKIVEKIKAKYPLREIIVRADAGFSAPKFYTMAAKYNLKFSIGIAANSVLNEATLAMQEEIKAAYLSRKEKFQYFTESFEYKAESWRKSEQVFAKIESTGKGMNVRYIACNMDGIDNEALYKEFYAMRGEAAENRIKEIKNMCFSDRLSCHKFWPNFFRLMLSGLTYEYMRRIKELIKKTSNENAKKWMVDNIRLFLLKVGATIVQKVRYLTIKFSSAFTQQELFDKLISTA